MKEFIKNLIVIFVGIPFAVILMVIFLILILAVIGG